MFAELLVLDKVEDSKVDKIFDNNASIQLFDNIYTNNKLDLNVWHHRGLHALNL